MTTSPMAVTVAQTADSPARSPERRTGRAPSGVAKARGRRARRRESASKPGSLPTTAVGKIYKAALAEMEVDSVVADEARGAGVTKLTVLRDGTGHNAPMEKEDHRTRVAAERRDRMRRRLFVSTAQLVAKQGTGATSIDDVIQTAEVSRGTFYKYFDSPQTLFDQLALEVANEIIRMAEPAVLQLKDPAERVASGMRLVIHIGASNREIAGFLVRVGWPEMRARGVLLDFVLRDLEQGLRLGRFVKMPMDLALNIVSMTVLGSVHAMLAPRAPRDFPDQAVASALRALGVGNKESERIAMMELPAPAVFEGGMLGSPAALRAGKKKPSRAVARSDVPLR